MNTTNQPGIGFLALWEQTFSVMQRIRPEVERRARSAPGAYLANLANEWRALLVRKIPL